MKNLLVFAAPGAAGDLTHGDVALKACGAFVVFCLAASSMYMVNDVVDAAADRHHTTKRQRPVAAGELAPSVALCAGAIMLAGSLGLAWLVAGPALLAVIAIYLAESIAYSLWLKHEPVIDLACVAAGFILRAIAGGVATGVPLSDWFLIVASFGSLFVVAGKRSAEHADLGELRGVHRPSLTFYTPEFLRSVRVAAMSVTLAAYCLWAFERAQQIGRGHHPIWFELSIVPIVLGMLHAERRFESGEGATPEDFAFRDRLLQVLALSWVVLFAIGLYG